MSLDLDFKELPKFTLSANELRQYTDCPRKRYYASRDMLAIRSNAHQPALELGSSVHGAFQYYYTEIQKILDERRIDRPEFEEVSEIYDSLPPYQLTAVLDGDNRKVFETIVSCYKDQLVQDLCDYKILGCEKTFNLTNWPIPDVMYHGFIDMVVMDRDTGFVYFFEHKTCKDFRPAIYDRFDIQLHIYAQYGVLEYGDSFGGMILNQVKKAKTERGYDSSRGTFTTDEEELNDFFKWIKAKTEGIVSPNNMHEPCNNYMNCKMCEYADICLKYGYKLPKSKEEIIDNPDFIIEEMDPETNETVKVPQFKYEPRDSREEEQ